MDIRANISELVERFTKDDALKKAFLSDPVKTVKQFIGKEFPDDAVEKIVEGVKAKLNIDSARGAIDKLKTLF